MLLMIMKNLLEHLTQGYFLQLNFIRLSVLASVKCGDVLSHRGKKCEKYGLFWPGTAMLYCFTNIHTHNNIPNYVEK